MKKGLKIFLLLSAIFAVTGIALIAVGIFGGATLRDAYLTAESHSLVFDSSKIQEETVEIGFTHDTESDMDAAFAVDSDEGIVSLDIDWISGSVQFVIHEDDRFGFSEDAGTPIEEAHKMVLATKGNTLEVKYADKVPLVGSIPTKHLTVFIPAAKASSMNEIRISVTSAEVFISGVAADKLIVSSVSGDVKAEDMTLSYVSIGTTSGEVYLKQLGASCNAEVNTVSGDVDLTGKYQEIEADTTSGEVRLSLSAPPQELEIDTTSGDVTLQIPDGMGMELEFETVSGDFKSDLPMSYRDESYVLNGGGAEYEVSTTSGDLTVNAYTES